MRVLTTDDTDDTDDYLGPLEVVASVISAVKNCIYEISIPSLDAFGLCGRFSCFDIRMRDARILHALWDW